MVSMPSRKPSLEEGELPAWTRSTAMSVQKENGRPLFFLLPFSFCLFPCLFQLLERDLHILPLAAPLDREGYGIAHLVVLQSCVQIFCGINRLAVERHDNVAELDMPGAIGARRPQARLGRRAVGQNLDDQDTLLHAQALSQLI